MRAIKTTEITERFPCEDCPCGCSTASFCWENCCCLNDQEKLDWAAKNGVEPPAFLRDRVAKLAGKTTTKPACCCSKKTNSAVESCATAPKPQTNTKTTTKTSKLSKTRILLLSSAAACRGIEQVLSMLAQLVIDPSAKFAPTDEPMLIDCLHAFDQTATSVSDQPDPPVPWRLFA